MNSPSGANSGAGPARPRARTIATVLVVSDSAVAKHINSIFAKLGLSAADGDRRVLAVLHFLDNA